MRSRILLGDCRTTLATLPDQSVQTCVTSPPYFGLRDYGMAEQIGLEQTPDAFVAELVAVFREVRRVLRDDGTLWLNLGDSYANDTKWGGSTGGKHAQAQHGNSGIGRRRQNTGLKPKDLIGIPWRVAFALQADGWYLRQDIIWHKPNPMPESVTDRCTKAHEYIFLFAKSPKYYFDSAAMQEPAVGALAGNKKPVRNDGSEMMRTRAGLHGWAERQRSKRDTFKRAGSKRAEVIPGQTVGTHRPDREESTWPTDMRNKRSVWTVATKPYKGAHFATFPADLIEPCVRAGAPINGVVLDPFNGSGTTGAVALSNGRKYIGCELNPEYITLTEQRLAKAQEEQLW